RPWVIAPYVEDVPFEFILLSIGLKTSPALRPDNRDTHRHSPHTDNDSAGSKRLSSPLVAPGPTILPALSNAGRRPTALWQSIRSSLPHPVLKLHAAAGASSRESHYARTAARPNSATHSPARLDCTARAGFS